MTRKPQNHNKPIGVSDALDSNLSSKKAIQPVQGTTKDWININFKAERSHRRHWKAEAAKRDEDISKVLREYLVERYGLPDKGE